MRWIVSRYNQNIEYIKEYTDDVVLYDRSEKPLDTATFKVPNIGSDIMDKFTYIVDNYDNLPNVAVYTKANLFQYIHKDEFDELKDNTIFTPLLTQRHKTKMPISFYEDGMYYEVNNFWYLYEHPAKFAKEIIDFFHMEERDYNAFAPGSNYILTKKDIKKHPKSLYVKLLSFLDWDIYPGDAFLIERNLFYLWGTDLINSK